MALVVMLNPSTADAEVDDPTIRRLIGFMKGYGMGGFHVLNLFAFRATDPDELARVKHDLHQNLQYFPAAVEYTTLVVCAWGANKAATNIDKKVYDCLRMLLDALSLADRSTGKRKSDEDFDIYCLGTTAKGHPKHPLYLKSSTPLSLYTGPRPRKERARAEFI